MPWANLDDQFPKHPKVLRLSDGAFRLHISGICYAAQYLTDGLIDADVVPLLMPRFQRRYVTELVERTLWIQRGDVYEIHDYLEWNRSKDQVEAERERKRRAGRKGAEKRWSA